MRVASRRLRPAALCARTDMTVVYEQSPRGLQSSQVVQRVGKPRSGGRSVPGGAAAGGSVTQGRVQADVLELGNWMAANAPAGDARGAVAARVVNVVQYVGSEFIGTCARIVVTPLTERYGRCVATDRVCTRFTVFCAGASGLC